MNTRCPHCQTSYNVDPEILRQAQGMARCFNCGKVFDAFTNSIAPGTADPDTLDTPSSLEPDSFEFQASVLRPAANEPAPDNNELFRLSEELESVQIDDDAVLDLDKTLQPRRRTRAPLWQTLLMLLLLLLLVAQLAWWQRARLPGIPLLSAACAVIDCRVPPKRAPELYQVVERNLSISPDQAHALRLQLVLRNTAPFAQPLPRLVISLFSNSGQLLIRRTLQPAQYLFPAPAPNQMIAANTLLHVKLLFEDPGVRADNFTLDFR